MLTLSERDREMLAGDRGPAAQLAMSIVVRMAAVYGASELMDVSQAHIDSTIYLGDATLEFAERLASLGARVAVPTSLNVSGVDECGWQDWAVTPEWAAKAARQMLAYQRMGAVPTWTCAPYQTDMDGSPAPVRSRGSHQPHRRRLQPAGVSSHRNGCRSRLC